MREIISLPFEAAMRHHNTTDAITRTRARLARIRASMKELCS